MTDKKKQKILNLVRNAENNFATYLTICEQIERLLQEETAEEIAGVQNQMSDGIIVVVNREVGVPINIPVNDYLREIKK